VVVEAACLGDESDGKELLEPLRELEPDIDTFAQISAPLLQTLHMDPEPPVPAIGDGILLTGLSPDTIDELVGIAGANTNSPLLSVEVRHLGGALSKTTVPSSIGTAAFAVYSVGMPVNPDVGALIQQHLGHVRKALETSESRYSYINFADQPTDPATLFPAETYRRLQEIKAKYDPHDIFQGNHEISPVSVRT
jgi:FAD/FMN-containing dehydrogenase